MASIRAMASRAVRLLGRLSSTSFSEQKISGPNQNSYWFMDSLSRNPLSLQASKSLLYLAMEGASKTVGRAGSVGFGGKSLSPLRLRQTVMPSTIHKCP